jgi:hypothetical protein
VSWCLIADKVPKLHLENSGDVFTSDKEKKNILNWVSSMLKHPLPTRFYLKTSALRIL